MHINSNNQTPCCLGHTLASLMRRFPVLRQVFAANTAVVVCQFLCRLLALPQRCNHIRNTRNSLYKAATTWNRRDKGANVGRYQANSLQITGRTDEPFFFRTISDAGAGVASFSDLLSTVSVDKPFVSYRICCCCRFTRSASGVIVLTKHFKFIRP